jgi:phytoene dehydrogenase-like protein
MPLAEHGLRWSHPDACYAHPLDGGDGVVLHRDLERTAASLDAHRTGDGERWVEFVTPYLRAWDAVRDTMLSGFPPIAPPLRLAASLGPRGALGMGRLLTGSMVALGRRLFAGDGSRAWLYGSALHADVAPTAPGGGLAAMSLNLLGHVVGWPSPEGGAQRVTDALVSYLRSLGGDVVCDAPVVRVLHDGRGVRGVRLADGEEIAARLVVGAVLPQALERMAGDGLPRWYRALARRYQMGPATVKVDWALDGPIPWSHAPTRTAGVVHVAGGTDEFLQTIATSRTAPPERPFLLLGQQTLADPSRAPAGRHTAWAYTRATRQGVTWDDRAVAAHAERIEAQVERYAPGFGDRILARHVLGPRDLQARNASLLGGDVGGGSYRLGQLVFRPVPAANPYRTPLRGLYIGSAATFPGGGVHGVGGDAAARTALADGQVARRGRAPVA